MVRSKTTEFSWEDYQVRQASEVRPDRLAVASNRTRPGHKFHRSPAGWQPEPYRGYAVVSMVDTNPGNDTLGRELSRVQRRLEEFLNAPDAFAMLPPSSFHQTIANTFSAERLDRHVAAQGLEGEFPRLVSEAMAGIPHVTRDEPLTLRLIGVSVFTTSFGLLATIPERDDFNQIICFRDHIYTHPSLRRVDIARTRPFVGHISLGYIERELSESEKQHLAASCARLNDELAGARLVFTISHTELRRYDHLAAFNACEGYPRHWFRKPQ
jgi:hypothetical protein